MSGRYDINNAENNSSIYFVQVDEKTVGAVTVFDCEGEKISSFMYKEDGFEKMPEDEEMPVSSNAEGIDICTRKETKVLSGKGNLSDGEKYKYDAKNKNIDSYNISVGLFKHIC